MSAFSLQPWINADIMTADISLQTLGQHLGQSAGDAAIDLANAAADGACSLYKLNPIAFAPDPVGAGAMSRAFMDTLCKGRSPGLPNPPKSDFQGGQCPGVLYQYDINIDAFASNGSKSNLGNNSPNGYESFLAYGSLDGITMMRSGIGYAYFFLAHDQFGNSTHQFLVGSNVNGDTNPLDHYVINYLHITRLDGHADNCGNPATNWPNPGNSITFPAPLPPVSVPSGDGGGFNFSPTLVKFDNGSGLVIKFNPSFSIKFNFGGVIFDFGGSGAGGGTDLTDIENKLDSLANNLNTLNNGFNNYKDYPPPAKKPTADSHNKTPKPAADGDKQKNISNLEYVEITLTALPTAGKIIYATPPSPNILFAGWFEFLSGDEPIGTRMQIQFQNQIFRAPDGADGYSYTFSNGAQGNASVYTKKQ